MMRDGRIRSASLTRSRRTTAPVPSSPLCRVCMATQSACRKSSSNTSSALTTRCPPGMAAANVFSMVVLPAWVAPLTTMLSPATTLARRKRAASGLRLPIPTRSSRRAARTTYLRMLTAENPREMPSSTTCRRCPPGSIASTNGWLTSMRRPLDLSIRSTSSKTCALVSTVGVSS
jgi:hypothetical protein